VSGARGSSSGRPDRRFRWCVGIEDTSIGVPIRHSGRTLDEYELTQHYSRFREDLALAASLGADSIRYGIPWYRVHPAPGRFEWRWVDESLECAVALGLDVIADLVHYGTPVWLPDAFVDPAFPRAMAEYAEAFARRYGSIVRHYTPLNEPTITALFCGERGLWPPYLSGSEGWLRVVLGTVAGIRAAIEAIRGVDRRAVIVHVEAAKQVRPGEPRFEREARVSRERAFLPTDLLLGRVDEGHPLAAWMREHGVDPAGLRELRQDAPTVDVLGVNFYPDFSVREMVEHHGRLAEVAGGGRGEDLADTIGEWHARYGLPVFVSETSAEGSIERRTSWLRESVDAVRRAADDGTTVWGYTWWPLFDFVDWAHAASDTRVEEFLVRVPGADGTLVLAEPPQPSLPANGDGDIRAVLRPMGLWALEPDADGGLRRAETAAAAEFRAHAGGD
jgi:beta-glucosidase